PRSDENDRGEERQAAFLRRALEEAEQLSMPFVVWFVGQDPSFGGEASFEALANVGLRWQNGGPKRAWTAWQGAASRPLTEQSGVEPGTVEP
ncbi:MAG: hypothetical protein U1B78_04380, partial [Dehalococcoidia bacterium]|nr:hypothetical protein [Dehalococcoidia bacterium]